MAYSANFSGISTDILDQACLSTSVSNESVCNNEKNTPTVDQTNNVHNNDNANNTKRSRYSALPEEKKEEIRKKRRERYYLSKLRNPPQTMISEKKSWYSKLSEDKKEEIRKKRRERYHQNKINNSISNKPVIQCVEQQSRVPIQLENMSKDTQRYSGCALRIQEPLSEGKVHNDQQMSDPYKTKGKMPVTQYSSFEIGSTSSENLKQTCLRNKAPNTSASTAPNKRSWYSALPENKKEEIRKMRREKYIQNKAIDISNTAAASNCLETNTQHKHPLQNIPQAPSSLPSVKSCKHCGAKRFYGEPKGFCCADGEISLASSIIPDELYYLYTSTAADAKHFQTYVRTYNNTFAFTSFGVKYDKSLCKRNKGIYTFRVQGQVYHFINELLPNDAQPSYLQLYFYDTEHELQNRLNVSNKLNSTTIERLTDILRKNPYVSFFRQLKDIPIPELQTHNIIIREDTNLDQRVYNAPTASQVGAIWLENNECPYMKERDIIIYGHKGFSHKVQYYYGCYDPLQYPLLFPHGDTGWHEGIKKKDPAQKGITCRGEFAVDANQMPSAEDLLNIEETVLKKGQSKDKKRKNVSCREYYCYKLQIRPSKSILLFAKRLLQQFVVDMYIKIETSRLDYFRNNQLAIRADLYKGVVDSITGGETRGSNVGKRIILPASFIGGPRDMRKRYIDAMSLVQRFGKPDIFLTMTCNPNWPEIKKELLLGEQSQDRPDLIARIFHAKLQQLKHELINNKIFGPIAAYVYVVEFQKRGLPHVHFLIILKASHKLICPEQYDSIVCAEIPNRKDNPHLYEAVVKHMMHGPCGNLNRDNVCMNKKTGTCKNRYPKEFCSTTTHGKDSYPKYRRREDGKIATVRHATLDNRWVVPYNPYLLATFDCHINVEICSTLSAVKYLYKYIYKGHDRIAFHILAQQNSNDVDEITNFQTGRWISAPEAMWRIYRFRLYEMYPSVQSLQLHLENHQSVTFKDHNDLTNIINDKLFSKTTLTEYFEMNKRSPNARKCLHKDFPEQYVWDSRNKIWYLRKQKDVVGRVVAAFPTEGERYYLRLLLNHTKGATSFEDLKTVNGVVTSSYREAAFLRGLLKSDTYLEQSLEEASNYQMPYLLRQLFATILVYCCPNNPKSLWAQYEQHMTEDYRRLPNLTIESIKRKGLQSLSALLESMGKNINNYDLTDENINLNEDDNFSKEILDELNIIVSEKDILSINMLNPEQKRAYNIIIERVFSNKPGAFFIDGPGGTGKTYLYCALLASVRSKRYIALATATSGVAASNMPLGRTAHSRFKLPINITENASCNITKESNAAKLLRTAKLIIWDEASMAKRQLIEAVDRMLQDITNNDLPFGGKVIVFGGDFRQVVPVNPKKSKAEQIDGSLVKSTIWHNLEKLKLTINMRAIMDPGFSNYLLRVGNGTEEAIIDDIIQLPAHLMIPYIDDKLL